MTDRSDANGSQLCRPDHGKPAFQRFEQLTERLPAVPKRESDEKVNQAKGPEAPEASCDVENPRQGGPPIITFGRCPTSARRPPPSDGGPGTPHA